jgi:hypothetical protein
MNFLHWNPMPMSSNETPKEEPKFELSAPSIVPAASNEKAAEPVEPVTAKSESTVEKLPEAPKLAGSSAPEPEMVAPKITLLPALRTAPAEKAEKKYGPEIVMKPRSSARFGLLAACVAIAASFGAVAGSLSVAKLGPMFAPAPLPVAAVPAPKDNLADDVKALRDTVAQLRATTKSLSDNLAGLKTAVSTSNSAQNGQIAKLTEALDRVEKGQAEPRGGWRGGWRRSHTCCDDDDRRRCAARGQRRRHRLDPVAAADVAGATSGIRRAGRAAPVRRAGLGAAPGL